MFNSAFLDVSFVARLERAKCRFQVAIALAAAVWGHSAVADDESDPAGVDIVVVSATRSRHVASDLPVSIDRVSGETLRDGKLQVNISESLARVPGINAENRQNYAQDLQISSRGFGARSTFGVRGMRLYSDGIPATMPDGQGQVAHFDLNSAESMEILRGPFSVLYGNAAGGVISITTEEGGPETVLEPSLAIGSFSTTRFATKASGMTNDVAYVASGWRFRTNGYRQHSTAERELANVKLSAQPWAGAKVTLVANDFSSPNAQDPLGLTRAQMESDPEQAGTNAELYNTRKSVSQTQGGITLSAPVGAGGTVSVMAYSGQRDAEQYQSIAKVAQTPATHPGGVIDLSRDYSGFDLRWAQDLGTAGMSPSPLTLTVGISNDDMNEKRRGYQNFVGNELGVQGALRRDESNTVTARDVYSQVLWQPLSGLLLLGGVRYSQTRVDSNDHYIVAGNGNDSGKAKFSATTPAFGIDYLIAPKTNIYVSGGRGFETPTLNELSYQASGAAGLNFALQPATSKHLESGIKWRPGNTSSINAAVFRVKTDDEIAIATNAAGRSSFRNVGSTERSGFELAAQTRFGNGFSFLLAYTYLKAEYKDSATGVSPATTIVAGNRLPGIPVNSTYAELGWRHAPSGFVATVEVRHAGQLWVNDGNTDAAKSYTIGNLRLGMEQRSGRWAFSEFFRVDNVTDQKYVGTVIVNESLGRYFEPSPGRNELFGASARYVF